MGTLLSVLKILYFGLRLRYQEYAKHVTKKLSEQPSKQPNSQSADIFVLADMESEALTADERVKSSFAAFIVVAAPFILALILSISNGYFFAGFKGFSWDSVTFVSYAGGFTLEMVALGAIYVAQKHLKEGTRKMFWLAFLVALFLMLVSFVTQYSYLQELELQGTLAIPDASINHIPILSWFTGIGLSGHDLLFIIRSSAFHIA